jgi:hypothetical protein
MGGFEKNVLEYHKHLLLAPIRSVLMQGGSVEFSFALSLILQAVLVPVLQ